VIDGEIVAVDDHGKPSFNLLQGFGDAQAIVLYAFDLLMLRGNDFRLRTLEDRREQLRQLVPNLPDTIRYSETFNVSLAELMRAVKKHELEGIVAKRSGSPYRLGRTLRRLAQMAGESRTGVRNRRLHPKWRRTRFTPGRLLRRK
jgi:bifunctional non-homologous end joining protein LigD